MNLLWWLLVGLIAGALARLVVKGRFRFGILGTIVLGLVGAVIGGLVTALIEGRDLVEDFSLPGILGAWLGAIIALLIYKWWSGRRRGGVLSRRR